MAERQPGRSEKAGGVGHGDSYDGPPEYSSEKSHARDSFGALPSYQEAIEDNWTDVEYSDAEGAASSAPEQKAQEQGPPCVHWSESGCRMTVRSRKCCACLDERPQTESGLYRKYVDGQGWVEDATRWQYYCPSCREYFDPNAKAKSLRDQCAWAEKRAQSLADERDQRYFGLGRWIHKGGEALKSCLGSDAS